jgi:hypothetical protein
VVSYEAASDPDPVFVSRTIFWISSVAGVRFRTDPKPDLNTGSGDG